jgi:hypothetical protein
MIEKPIDSFELKTISKVLGKKNISNVNVNRLKYTIITICLIIKFRNYGSD